MEEFKSFFKYCSDNESVIKGIFKDHKIRFTQPWGMNDPLEFNPTIKFKLPEKIYQQYKLDEIIFPSVEQFYRSQIIESRINQFGILSLTKEPFSFDMWSHYANGHKGFLIEFKTDFYQHSCMKSKDGKSNILEKVEYVDNYFVDFDELYNEKGQIQTAILQAEIFFKKTSRWKGENEYRLVRSLQDSLNYSPHSHTASYRDDSVYLFDFSLECINSITFGANMSIKNKKLIINECKNHDIEFLQSYIIRNYNDAIGMPSRMNFISIKHLDDIEELYKFLPQLFSFDKEQISPEVIKDNNESVQIKELSELPYYKGNEKIVEEFIKSSTRKGN